MESEQHDAEPTKSPARGAPLQHLHQLESLAKSFDELGVEALRESSLGEVFHAGADELTSGTLDLEAASEFLVDAARLLQKVGREVMPLERDRPADSVEEGEEETGEELLMERMLEYHQFKQLAERLETRREDFLRRFPRGVVPADDLSLELQAMEGIELRDLIAAFENLLERVSSEPPSRVIARETITVAASMEQLTHALRERGGEAPFNALFVGRTRLELVVTFLALLELMRSGRVLIHQSQQFGEIAVILRNGGAT